MYSLLKFGVIITLLLVFAYVIMGIRFKHKGIMLLVIAITALNCMIAHHLPDVAYVIFTAFIFAKSDITKPKKEKLH